MRATKEHWGTRLGLVFAVAGNAIGLGNFLRFPVQAIQNGGGAFVIPYLVCFVLLGIPLIWIEWTMGRFAGSKGRHNTSDILHSLDEKRQFWRYVGGIGLFINLAVAAYYIYIESWTLTYAFASLFGTFRTQTPDQITAFFFDYTSHELRFLGISVAIWMWLLCLGLNIWILSRGIVRGIEVVAKIAIPLLLLFGILLALKGVSLDAGGESGAQYDGLYGLNFLWTPDFSTIWSPQVWLAAAGQIFFTLSVGMGAIQCYASFMRHNEDVALNAMAAGWLNEVVEVVIGSAIIIPIAIGYLGIDGAKAIIANAGGFGLGFCTLPALFSNWGILGSALGGMAWFLLLFFAGITSSLAMGMPFLVFLQDRFNLSRLTAAWTWGAVVFLLGLPCVLFMKYGVLDEYDFWAGTFMIVVFAFLELILVAWVWGIKNAWDELNRDSDLQAPQIFRFIAKYVSPLLLLFVLLGNIFQPEQLEGKIVSRREIHRKDTLFWKDTVRGKVRTRFEAFKPDTILHRDTLRGVNSWLAAADSLRHGKMWSYAQNTLMGVLLHKGIREEINATQDTLDSYYKKRNQPNVHKKIEATHEKIQFLRSKRRYMNASRMLLLVLGGSIMFAIWGLGRKEKNA